MASLDCTCPFHCPVHDPLRVHPDMMGPRPGAFTFTTGPYVGKAAQRITYAVPQDRRSSDLNEMGRGYRAFILPLRPSRYQSNPPRPLVLASKVWFVSGSRVLCFYRKDSLRDGRPCYDTLGGKRDEARDGAPWVPGAPARTAARELREEARLSPDWEMRTLGALHQWPEGHTSVVVHKRAASHHVSLWFVRIPSDEVADIPVLTPEGCVEAEASTFKWRSFRRIAELYTEIGNLARYGSRLMRSSDYADLTNI